MVFNKETSDKEKLYNKFYNGNEYEYWEHAPGKNVIIVAVADFLKKGLLPKSAKIVDVGCGTGFFMDRIYKEVNNNVELSGIDISSEAIAIGKKKYPYLAKQLFNGDGCETGFNRNYFDLLICYGSYEHFKSPYLGLKEAARILKKGGYIMIMVPTLGIDRTDRKDEGWYEKRRSCEQPRTWQMQWNYYRKTWEDLLKKASFKLYPIDIPINYGELNGRFLFRKKRIKA